MISFGTIAKHDCSMRLSAVVRTSNTQKQKQRACDMIHAYIDIDLGGPVVADLPRKKRRRPTVLISAKDVHVFGLGIWSPICAISRSQVSAIRSTSAQELVNPRGKVAQLAKFF